MEKPDKEKNVLNVCMYCRIDGIFSIREWPNPELLKENPELLQQIIDELIFISNKFIQLHNETVKNLQNILNKGVKSCR